MPDASRSGMFRALVPPQPPASIRSPSSTSGSSTTSSLTASDGDTDMEESLTGRSRKPAIGASESYVRHQRLQTLHKLRAADASKLACGRAVSVGFVQCTEVHVDWPRCK
eukprot:6463188-Amphidinium_carterae.1